MNSDPIVPFVVMKWSRGSNSSPGKSFSAEHVNNIHAMLANTQAEPFELFCITDDAAGLSTSIKAIPLPDAVKTLIGQHGHQFAKLFLHSRSLRDDIGRDFIFCDLDVAILGDLTTVYRRNKSDLLIMAGKDSDAVAAIEKINGGKYPKSLDLALLLKCSMISPQLALRFLRIAGRRRSRFNSSFMIISHLSSTDLWLDFNPGQAVAQIAEHHLMGSDQAWIQLAAKGSIGTVGQEDGFWYKGEVDRYVKAHKKLPPNLRMIIFPGANNKPWLDTSRKMEWVRKVYP
jgi:hypothetical protein